MRWYTSCGEARATSHMPSPHAAATVGLYRAGETAAKRTKIDRTAAAIYRTKFAIIIMQERGLLATEIGMSCARFLLDIPVYLRLHYSSLLK